MRRSIMAFPGFGPGGHTHVDAVSQGPRDHLASGQGEFYNVLYQFGLVWKYEKTKIRAFDWWFIIILAQNHWSSYNLR